MGHSLGVASPEGSGRCVAQTSGMVSCAPPQHRESISRGKVMGRKQGEVLFIAGPDTSIVLHVKQKVPP